jgi:O-antigen/teichoic acid export membrane protein
MLSFGLLAMTATALWNVGNQVSLWFTNRYRGPEEAGVYAAFRQLCQPVWVLSAVVWGGVFSHVASRWESSRRAEADGMLNLAYRAAATGLMTLSVAVLASGPLWSRLLRPAYRADLSLLGGLLMFFQCSANLGLASIAAKLRERPWVIVAMIAAGVATNAALAAAWVPAGGLPAAARAAGVGMLGPCLLGAAYLVAAGFRVHPVGHVLALAPALLLLPTPAVLVVWGAFLAVAALTGWVFTPHEKRMLLACLRRTPGQREP